jgi:hypothetical protein
MTVNSPDNSASNEFNMLVDCLILEKLNKNGINFGELLVSLPGIYPSTVLEGLARLVTTSQIHRHIYRRLLADSGREPDSRPRQEHRIKLPIEHPLDYEWRFGQTASQLLLDTAMRLVGSDKTMCLLGAPSILRYALEQGYSCPITLIDKNPLLQSCFPQTAGGNIFTLNVASDPLPEIRASVVMIDPPWYTEYMRAFIWAGYALSESGSYLLVSVPPKGTRPGVESEMEEVYRWMQQGLGLTRLEVHEAILPYRSPLFEKNALRAEGVLMVPEEWRRGDLWVFKSDHQRRNQSAKPAITDHQPSWMEVVLRNMRLKVRNSESSEPVFLDPSLISLVEMDVLPSVSRRDPRRDKVDLWTSGNRIFSTCGIQIVSIIVRALSAGLSAHDEVSAYLNRLLDPSESQLVSTTIEQLNKLSTLETAEIDRHGEGWTNAELVL